MTEDDAKLIAHDVVHGNYMRRSDANQLTGEWIIYAQHEGQNYYLVLGNIIAATITYEPKLTACACQSIPSCPSCLPSR